MLRPPFSKNATCRILNRIPRAPLRRSLLKARGSYSTQQFNPHHFSLATVRALAPTLWVFTATGIIYLGCAAYEVHQDVQEFKKHASGPATYNNIDAARMNKGKRQSSQTMGFSPLDVFTTPWSNLNSAEKILTTACAMNIGAYGIQRLSPSLFMLFAHVPTSARNFTLLSSMFGHGGIFHLAFNMFALSNFGPSLAASPTFESSGSHLTAFYLSSGLLASLAHHLSTVWSKSLSRSVPALGASGAIYAMLGAWAMNYPDAHLGLMLIPGSLPAEQALLAIFAFETWGAFVGWGLGFAHAAHLGGLGVGVAYVYLDGKTRLWQPTRRFTFNQMRRLKLV